MVLSAKFMSDLQKGHLSHLRSFLTHDQSLSPEIRDDTLSVYYRGGRLLMLKETDRRYSASFDMNYAAPAVEPWYKSWISHLATGPVPMNTIEEVTRWLENIPFLKAIMDRFFVDKTGREREAQQRVLLENNRDGRFSNATDFFFCDMETAENQCLVNGTREGLRFDLVGVCWPSTSSDRKLASGWPLVIAEAKYGDDALANLIKHYRDLQALVEDERRISQLKAVMLSSFRQKHQLGFISCQHSLESFAEGPVIWLLILINHDPAKQRLSVELNELNQLIHRSACDLIRVQVATSNFLGYGLWNEAIVDLGAFLRDFEPRISCRKP